MIFGMNRFMEKLSNIILRGKNTSLTDREFYELEISRWIASPGRIAQIKGQLYYESEQDILHRKRLIIGENGELSEVKNLPNNRVMDNQYEKLVSQKANYLVGKPFVIEGDNDAYVELLKQSFDKQFMKTLKNAVKYSFIHIVMMKGSFLFGFSPDMKYFLFGVTVSIPFWNLLSECIW